MQLTARPFKFRSREKLTDANLQGVLKKPQGNLVKGRADCVAELEDIPSIRDAAAAIRTGAIGVPAGQILQRTLPRKADSHINKVV